MVTRMLIFGWLWGSLLGPVEGFGSAFSFQTGATSIGSGGPNSLGVPPRSTDIGLTYITKSLLELNLNLMGITVGRRYYSKWGGILGLGGGMVLDANGLGPGITALFGYEFFRTKGGYALSLEYAPSLGLSFQGIIISPYIMRIGWSKWF